MIGLAIVLRRILLEDRSLQERLASYREYAARVPNRSIPGMW